MCGIIAGFNIGTNKENVNEDIVNQYQEQFSRGQRGFGIITINDDHTYKIFRATEPTKFLLDLYLNESKMIIAHHRLPTSSENKLSQTHPLVVNTDLLKHKYLFVHNGIIRNDDDRKEAHEKIGFKYRTQRIKSETSHTKVEEFNDSEALSIDLARYIEKHTKTIKTSGSMAFVALQIDKKTDKVVKVFYGRDTNPLNLAKSNKKIRITSEGAGNDIKQNILYSFNLNDYKIKRRKLVFTIPVVTRAVTTQWGEGVDSYGSYYGGTGRRHHVSHRQPTFKTEEHKARERLKAKSTEIINGKVEEVKENKGKMEFLSDKQKGVIEADISDMIMPNRNTAERIVNGYFSRLEDLEQLTPLKDDSKISIEFGRKLIAQFMIAFNKAKETHLEGVQDVIWGKNKDLNERIDNIAETTEDDFRDGYDYNDDETHFRDLNANIQCTICDEWLTELDNDKGSCPQCKNILPPFPDEHDHYDDIDTTKVLEHIKNPKKKKDEENEDIETNPISIDFEIDKELDILDRDLLESLPQKYHAK